MTYRRWLFQGLFALAVFLLSALLGHRLLESGPLVAADNNPSIQPAAQAAPGEGSTYLLTEVQIEYPFVDPFTQDGDFKRAGIKYTPVWASSQYPGPVACQVTLSGPEGSPVGERHFTLDSASPQPGPSSFVPVSVSAPPVSAKGTCDKGDPQAGAGYRFDENPTIESDSDVGSRIRFTAHWIGAVDPGTRLCTMTVLSKDGQSKDFGPVGFSVPDGAEATFFADIMPDEIADATVECVEITEDVSAKASVAPKSIRGSSFNRRI
jgi:hypothetical protein